MIPCRSNPIHESNLEYEIRLNDEKDSTGKLIFFVLYVLYVLYVKCGISLEGFIFTTRSQLSP